MYIETVLAKICGWGIEGGLRLPWAWCMDGGYDFLILVAVFVGFERINVLVKDNSYLTTVTTMQNK